MLRVIFRTIQLNAVPKRKRSVDLLLKALLSNMREDGRIGRSDMANEFVVESERFRMMLGDAGGRWLRLDAVDMLHRPLVW